VRVTEVALIAIFGPSFTVKEAARSCAMTWRSHKRRQRALLQRYRLEELEGRTLLSITAQAFSSNVLEQVASQIGLAPHVQESDPSAKVTYHLASTTTADGGTVSVNPVSGLVTYTPAASSSSQDSLSYFAQDSDGNTSATQTVTLNLATVAANPFIVNELEGQASIGLTILKLPGAVRDSSSKPSYTFSNLQVEQSGEGSVSLTNAHTGGFSYAPSTETFTGSVTITYQVTDGMDSSNSSVEINIGPIVAQPVVWGTLSSTSSTVPSTIVPSLKDRIFDVNQNAVYTFSNLIIPSGQGTVSNLDPTTGSFTYTAPSATFTGVAAVQYTVSDGSNSTTGEATVVVEPLVTQPVSVTELDHQSSVTLRITDLPSAVQDVASNPTYTFSSLRVAEGGGSVPAAGFDDPTTGTFTYTLPTAASPTPVHIEYSVTDGTNSADGVVTIQLAGIVANSARYSFLENSPSTLPPLAGRINDVLSDPTFRFSSPTVPTGDGTAQFTDTSQGILSYTPPSATFTGMVPVHYTVSDGTNTTTGILDLDVAPLITSPLLIPVALETQPTIVPSLVAAKNVQDVSSQPSYTFSNLKVPTGDGTATFSSTTTGALTYTPPSSSFFGLVQLTYTVTDGAGNSASGNVVINVEQTIQPGNDGPFTAALGMPLTIAPAQLLGNDTAAPDGLEPSIGSVGNAQNGTVVLNSNGSVTFTPSSLGPASFDYTDTDANSDASTIATVSLIVKRATTITWANPADITYGSPLSSTQLDATANVPGTFTYSPGAGAVLSAGNGQTLKVSFTPTDSANYAGDTAEVQINVAQAPTTISWSNPADIVFGTPLGGAQLDATASVPGTLTYIPAPGTVLGVGKAQTLAVVFTPSDATYYTGGYATVSINVQPPPPPGLAVQTHPFFGRKGRSVGGVIAQLHTTLSRLRTNYYSALINWDDGTIQAGKLSKAGTHGFKVNATHKYRVAGSYNVTVTISDPQGDRLTSTFLVNVH
jgi:hypothetical protein